MTYPYPDIQHRHVTRVAELDCPTDALGLLSFVRSGHTREAAVRALGELSDGSELPFLLLRLNDWVRAVAKQAAKAVGKRVMPEQLPTFAKHLALLDSVRRKRRVDHGPLLERIDRLWSSEAGTSTLHHALRSSPDPINRRVAAKTLELIGAPVEFLLDGLRDVDPVVRYTRPPRWRARRMTPSQAALLNI